MSTENDNRVQSETELREKLDQFEQKYGTRDEQFYRSIQELVASIQNDLPNTQQLEHISKIASQLEKVQVTWLFF